MKRCEIHLLLLLIFNSHLYSKHLLTSVILFICCTFNEGIHTEEILKKADVSNNFVSTSAIESYDNLESKFHIKADTIIRTQESRSSGAKYLNDSSVATNYECLLWCWETHGCNAVVFQQKAKGSCYLFDCGSPNNFHCKFTRHNLYISSILKATQHSYDLNQWGNEVKHENELVKMHTNSTNFNRPVSVVSPSPMTTVETKPITILSSKETELSNKTESKCHHYQFQCINNSECIAIYNVCDGIPQCLDASDENELHCPTQNVENTANKPATPVPHLGTESSVNTLSKALVPSVLARPTYPTSKIHEKVPVAIPERNEKQNWKDAIKQGDLVKNDDINIPWPDRYIDNESPEKDYKHHSDGSDSLGAPFLHKHSQFVAANDPHVQSLNRWSSDYDEYPQHSGPLDQQYIPYNSNYQRPDDQYSPNQFVPEFETNKHYNNYHQEDVPYWQSQGSLQDNSYPSDEFVQSSLRNLHKPSGYHDDSYISEQMSRTGDQYPVPTHHILHSKYMDNLLDAQKDRISNTVKQPKQRMQSYLPYKESLQKSYPDYPEVRPRHYETPHHSEGMYDKDDIIRSNVVDKLPIEDIRRVIHPKQTVENTPKQLLAKGIEKSLETKKKKISADETSKSKASSSDAKPQTVVDFKMSVTELFQSSRTHIHETNSAILALVLGLVVTSMLVVLTICRVRTIRRKLSRKGRSLAHDADYLVNGMYL